MSTPPKSVQIPLKTLLDLYRYFCLGVDDPGAVQGIIATVEGKLDALARRDLYSDYKNSTLSPAERQEALRRYLKDC